MSDIKISQMEPWVGPLTGNEEFPVVTANAQGTNFRVALSQITPSTLGFGSMALQNSNAVNITGGNVAVTALSGAITVANGGTGTGDAPGVGEILIGNGVDYTLSTLTAGSGITITNTPGGISIAAVGDGSGTVTSVNASGGTTGLSFSGGPITTSGTLTLGGTLAIANGGTGATTASSARANLGAAASGANSDITSLSGLTTPLSVVQGGTGTDGPLSGYVFGNGENAFTSVATIPMTDLTGTLPVTKGGTGATTAAAARVNLLPSYVGNGGRVLALNSTATDTEWAYLAGIGTVTSVNVTGGTTGLTTTGGPITTAGSIALGGTLITANGGTGLSSYTSGDMLFYAAGDAMSKLALGASTYMLTSNGTSPQWSNPTSVTVGNATNAVNATTATNLAGGAANRISYQTSVGATGFIAAPTIANTFLEWSGSSFQWSSNPLGTVTSVGMTVPVGLTVSGSPITSSGTLAVALQSGYSIPTTSSQANWDSAYADRLKWDGGSTGLVAATGRASLGGTTVGSNLFTLTNPSAVTYLRLNADNTVSALDAATFRTAIGAGTVTLVSGSGGTTGLTLNGGPITGSGTLTLGGTLAVANGGTGATTAGAALTNLGATTVGTNLFTLANPGAVTFPRFNADNTVSSLDAATFRSAIGAGTGNGTVTSVTFSAGTTGLSVTGSPITSSGTITLAGTLITSNGGTGLTSYTAGDLVYYASGTALSKLAIGASSRILTSSGSAPQWSDPATVTVGSATTASTATSATTATNIAGGASGSIPYQSAAGTTTFLASGTGVLAASGGNPGYTMSPSLTQVTVAGDPTTALQVATKQYVDGLVASGITYHAPVKYEVPNTTGNLNATYNNGTGGVGATLTNAGTLGAFTPDGVVAQVGDRILIYNQTNAFENGVYTVTTVGSGSVAWVLTRATDANSYALKSPNALGEGDAFFIQAGNTGAGETYVCNTTGTITFGTTAINFVQVSDSTLYTAGTGLTLNGTEFSLTAPVATTLGGTGLTSFTSGGAVYASSTSALTTGTLPVASGGTGQTSYTDGQLLIGNTATGSLSKATLTAGSGITITNGNGSITIASSLAGGTVTSINVAGGTTGLTFSGGPITTSGTITMSGTLAVANGGTGSTTAAGARTNLGATTVGANLFTLTNPGAITFPRFNADNTVSTLDAATFRTAIGAGTGNGTVTSVDISGGTTGLTASGGPVTSSGTITLAGTLAAANGGTGQSSYAVGDILYASTTSALSKLAGVATGNALISGGVGTAPSWGKIGLTTHVSGTLPIANGGTNATATPTAGAVAYGTGTAYAFTTAGTAGQVLLSNGSSAPAFGGIDGGTF